MIISLLLSRISERVKGKIYTEFKSFYERHVMKIILIELSIRALIT